MIKFNCNTVSVRKFVFILMLTLSLGILPLAGQELRCNVSVVAQSIQGTNKQVFETLQVALNEFMNNQQWTDKVYASQERIECSILINIKEEISVSEFKGTIQVQSRRPVYGSSYNSTLFNFLDQDFQIKYVEYQPLVYNPNTFESNLVGIMAYYAYMIIGMDEDSFEINGGSASFQKAQNIVSRAQNTPESGWRSFDGRKNRYWLVENVLNEYHKPLRLCVYKYHREGLDQMTAAPDKGRVAVADGIELLRKVHQQVPGSFLLQVFFGTKADELVDIFSESAMTEKNRMSALLTELDPTNIDKYKRLTTSN
jgi:hypothetical protein